MQERLAILLSKKLSGEASQSELNELEEWIRDNEQDHYLIETLQSFWHSHSNEDQLHIDDDAHVVRILSKAALFDKTPVLQPVHTRKQRLRTNKKWLAIAATLFLLLTISTVAFLLIPFEFNSGNSEIATSLGAKSHIVLPDGSQVWLNADTRLHFDKNFNGPLREIYLEGEAYFDVAKDKNRPFIVHTSDIDIKVLGTAFNVKSYKDEPTIEATLIHGSIQVSSNLKQNIPKILLSPNEKLIFSKLNTDRKPAVAAAEQNKIEDQLYFVSKLRPVTHDSSFVETSWIHDRLLFEGDTFKELAIKMERWFDVKIIFDNEEVSNYRLRGVFEDEAVDEALKALQQIAQFKFTIKGKTVTITK